MARIIISDIDLSADKSFITELTDEEFNAIVGGGFWGWLGAATSGAFGSILHDGIKALWKKIFG